MLDEGAGLKDIAKDEFSAFVKYFRGFQRYQALTTDERDYKSKVLVITGDPGTFKSAAVSRLRNGYHVVRPTSKGQGCWYDGYEPGHHSTVIFDDFTGGWMPYHNVLELCDRYACQVQTKGGTAQFKPVAMGFTSNYPADQWYPGMDFAALERRIDLWFEHLRTDANDDARGLVPGDIVVRVKKGAAENHPMFEVLEQIGDKEWKLAKEIQDEIADTQLDPQVEADQWRILYGETAEPDGIDEVEMIDDGSAEPSHESISSDDEDIDDLDSGSDMME